MLGPRPTSERLRAIEFRIGFLHASLDSLQALADAGDEILKVDAAPPPRKLIPYTIRASIIVMACATIDGCLVHLANKIREIEKLTLGPNDLQGSSLDKARTFFKKVARLRFPDETRTWCKLKVYFELRHALVHSWGHITNEGKRKMVADLKDVDVSDSGEVNLDAAAVGEALRVMRDFANELQEFLSDPQYHSDGT
jgi:hypothetical protein